MLKALLILSLSAGAVFAQESMVEQHMKKQEAVLKDVGSKLQGERLKLSETNLLFTSTFAESYLFSLEKDTTSIEAAQEFAEQRLAHIERFSKELSMEIEDANDEQLKNIQKMSKNLNEEYAAIYPLLHEIIIRNKDMDLLSHAASLSIDVLTLNSTTEDSIRENNFKSISETRAPRVKRANNQILIKAYNK